MQRVGILVDYLDHNAVAVVVKLGEPADSAKLCVSCLMGALAVDRWALMKSIRALITTGRILCIYERCSVCRRIDLVVSHRRSAFSN